MSYPSPPPSPAKRPALGDRPLSGNSLSSSAKQSTQKVNRNHVVGANRSHVRNTSYGRGLGKAGKINSAQNLFEDGVRHHRNKSSGGIPSTSPRSSAMKRNSSHAALAKNTSHVNLRKNKSANALARNLSHTQLYRKTGLGPSAPKPRKEASKKQKGFELGDMSSDEELEEEEEGEEEEEEAEWEDSATQSPKLTRSNSAISSQPAPPTTSERAIAERPPEALHHDRTSSPLQPSIRHNRSAPNFGARESCAPPILPPDPPVNPTLLQHNSRSSRAPPAMSSISAEATRDLLPRKNFSFTHINHAETASYNTNTLLNTPNTPQTLLNTPNTAKSAGASSSADGGVSHFLSPKPTSSLNQQRRTSSGSGSDYDSPSSFLPHYHPQQSTSPEKTRVTVNGRILPSTSSSTTKSEQHRSSSHLPSRTQQRLELQRRETMRANAHTTPSTPLTAASRRGSSAISLHSRSGSHGRNGPTDPASAVATRLMITQDYEAAERQLAVVRRFRNPVVEAVGRLKELGVLTTGGSEGGDGRERDRRKKSGSRKDLGGGSRNLKSEPNLMAGGRTGAIVPRSSTPEQPRSSSRGRSTRLGPASTGGKVHHRRLGSHDDIGLSRSQGSYDGPEGDQDGGGGLAGSGKGGGGESGVSAEGEMMRRMWESREVYDKGDGG